MHIDLNSCRLVISDLMLSVRLGWHPHEQEHARQVPVTIELYLMDVPRAVNTDKLEDTVCYAKLIRHVQGLVEGKSFHLVEKLAKEIYKHVYSFLEQEQYHPSLVRVTVQKTLHEELPVGSVSFTYNGGAE